VGQWEQWCQQDGMWDGIDFTCERIACPTIRSPGLVRSCEGVYGQTCSLSCSADSNALDSTPSTVMCDAKGTWQGHIPQCNQVRLCPREEVVDPVGGKAECNGFVPGSNCQFFCDTGFRVSGSVERQCMTDGKWSGEAPVW
jgi:hypothetical protein